MARYALVGGLLIVILAHHHVLESVPIQPMPRDYDIYHQMAEDREAYVVVEVPVAAGDGVVTVGDPKDLAPMFYGAIHGKPMITGHLSRAYIDYFWYLRTDHPVLSWLGQRRLLEADRVEAAVGKDDQRSIRSGISSSTRTRSGATARPTWRSPGFSTR